MNHWHWVFFSKKKTRHPQEWTDMIIPYGYGSIPMKIPFLGGWTFILTQLFWCELQGYMVLTHPHMIIPYNSPFHWDEDWPLHNPNVGLLVTPETTTSPWGLALLEPARWQENVPGTWRVWDMCAIYLCRSLVGFFFLMGIILWSSLIHTHLRKKTKQLVWLQFCGCCGTARLDRNHGTMLGEERSCHVCLRMGRMGMSQPPWYPGEASK